MRSFFQPASLAVVHAAGGQNLRTLQVLRNARARFQGVVAELEFVERLFRGPATVPAIEPPDGVVPELAVLCTPPAMLPAALHYLGEAGTRAVVIPGPVSPDSKLDDESLLLSVIKDAARRHSVRVLGPDSLGVIVPASGLNASYAHVDALAGGIAFIAESAGIASAVLDWTQSQGFGLHSLVHLGQALDVTLSDVLDHLAAEAAARAIVFQFASVRRGREFMSAARGAARNKPVLALRTGRVNTASRSATTDGGQTVEGDEIYAAALQRAGVVRVLSLDDLFDALEVIERGHSVPGDRLAIVSNGAGIGRLATDVLLSGGGRLADIGAAARAQVATLVPGLRAGGTLELPGDAPPQLYRGVVEAVATSSGVDAVLVVHAPTALVSGKDVAAAVCQAATQGRHAVFTCWPGGANAGEARAVAHACGVPAYTMPEKAISVFLGVAQYRRLHRLLLELPPSVAVDFEPDRARAGAMIAKALAAGRSHLNEPEVRAVLEAYGMTMVEATLARSGAQAMRVAVALGFPLTLRAVLSDEAELATGLGARELESEQEVADAIKVLRRAVRRHSATARISGFSLRRSDPRPAADRLMVAVIPDPVFGPVIVFGEATFRAQAPRQRAVALLPLNMALAHDLITRVQRDEAASQTVQDDAALARALVGISQLISDCDEIAELAIEPLWADAGGVTIADANIRLLARARRRGAQRFSVRPYPRELERHLQWRGAPLSVRPIRPEDEAGLAELLESLPPQDMRSRFFTSIKQVPRSQLARFTQIDYDREMAMVVVDETPEHQGRLLAEARAVIDAESESAEFAISVRPELAGQGLGRLLLDLLVVYCRERGLRELKAHMLADNQRMQRLAQGHGFVPHPGAGAGILDMRLDLRSGSV